MPRKTVAALLAQADATIEDNTTQNISAADVRGMIKDFLTAFAPGYGVVSDPSRVYAALGTTPVPVLYSTILVQQAADFTINTAVGTITRLSNGLPNMVTRITFCASVAAPDGNEVVFDLQRDGASMPGGITVSARGIGNVAECSFDIINPTGVNAPAAYRVMVSKISGAADDVTLTNVRLIAEVVPTLGP